MNTTHSIVKNSTVNARRTVLSALAAATLIVVCFLVERYSAQSVYHVASSRLIEAQAVAGEILLADERLTLSALMATETGDQYWLNRYQQNLGSMYAALDRAAKLAPPEVAQRFDLESRSANDELVKIERAALAYVAEGKLDAAKQALQNRNYEEFKQIFWQGTQRFVADTITALKADVARLEEHSIMVMSAVAIGCLLGVLLLWRGLNHSLNRSELAFTEAEETIRKLAMSDVLTGIANRFTLQQSLSAALMRAERGDTKVALLLIDLDRFKPINDTYGHLVGDLVLMEVAKRLDECLRQNEIRARYGGDEFVVVLEYVDDDEGVTMAGKRISQRLCDPMQFDAINVRIGASIGYAIYPEDALDANDLLRKADLALYEVKSHCRGQTRRFRSTMAETEKTRALLEMDMRDGLNNGEFVPFYQPLVDLGTGTVRGFEVLARWRHPSLGVISPADFIPAAEAASLIDGVLLEILRKACLEMRDFHHGLPIAINISPRQLHFDGLVSGILGVLEATHFPPARLEVEITETALVENLSNAKAVVAKLKAKGISIALDDFGTGYSSLCYLSEFGFDKIKIDRSFVHTLHQRNQSMKVVGAIIGLGQSLGVATIAEGIETEREAATLIKLGCLYGQGYLYSKPIDINGLNELVAKHKPSSGNGVGP